MAFFIWFCSIGYSLWLHTFCWLSHSLFILITMECYVSWGSLGKWSLESSRTKRLWFWSHTESKSLPLAALSFYWTLLLPCSSFTAKTEEFPGTQNLSKIQPQWSITSFVRYLLVILMANMILYVAYYCSMKFYYSKFKKIKNEALNGLSCFYFVSSLVFMAIGVAFFAQELKSSAKSPAESR